MVAVVVATDATEAIPLLDDNGSGVYNKGRNNITEFRREFLGGMIAKTGGTPFGWRQGIFASGVFVTGVPADGLVQQSGGGGGTQAVSITQHRSLINRSSGIGPYLWSQDGNINSIAAPAADGTNPRIDLLCEMPYDKGAFPADAQHGPKYIWVTGDPLGSPAVPALPVAVSDAMVIAQVARAANDNTIATADITDLRKGTSLQGALRVMFPGDLLADVGGYHGELRLRQSGAGITAITPVTELVDRWSAIDSKWHGTQNLPCITPAQTGSGALALSTTATISTLTIPDMGFAYKLIASGSFEYTSVDANAYIKAQVTVGSAAVNVGVVARGAVKWPGTAGGESKFCGCVPDDIQAVTVAAGSTAIVRLLAQNVSGASGITIINGADYGFRVVIVPV